MKNHYSRAGIHTETDSDDLARLRADASASPGTEYAEDVDAACELLNTDDRRTQYRRSHVQYQTLAAALTLLDHPIATDSLRWRERLVEFEPES